ncbi:MAG: peptide deformylase [Gemmatimonadetes bacterium]|nr:peptide deformylase [Gemmatimonadota bacterium]
MERLKIELLGAPILRQRAADVDVVDDEVRDLVRRMFDAMYAANGQGLAAPQVGIPRRIVVLDLPHEDTPSYALVNPRVVERAEERARGEEGCLSIPGVTEIVERPARVVVEAVDADGAPLRIEADGELARCLQHEIDHLDGILYIDHLSPLKRKMLLARYRKQQTRTVDA